MDKLLSHHPKWGNNKNLYYINDDTNKLIIGTIPPYRLCTNELNENDINFYYGSKDNYFWNIMKFLDNKESKDKNLNNYVDIKISNIVECKKFLDKNKIGIIDIVKECYHELNDKNKPLASDDALQDIVPIELNTILKKYDKITTLFCTSRKVLTFLNKYYSVKINIKENTIIFKDIGKTYKLYRLYSPTKRVFYRYKNDRKKYLKNYYKLINND